MTGRNAVMFHFYFMTSKYNLRLVAGSRKAPEAVTSLFSARRIFIIQAKLPKKRLPQRRFKAEEYSATNEFMKSWVLEDILVKMIPIAL